MTPLPDAFDERGLLAPAFHPEFARSGLFYVNCSATRRPESPFTGEPLGTANIGGFIYRGSALPELYGKLVFGDFSTAIERPSGQVFVATPPRSWGSLWPAPR